MEIPLINDNTFAEKLKSLTNPFFKDYYAFYSSWFGGITTNPQLMLLPIDDHMVHRGDGVFDAMKAVNRSVYLMDEHLERLFASAAKIGLKSPVTLQEMKEIILATLRVANKDNAMIRVFISRGPGNFSVNPYDSIQSQIYVVVAKLTALTPDKYKEGVAIGKSSIPTKSSWMAQVKSCNYLSNVLMKKESIDRGLAFTIGIDSEGYLTEGATENILIVDQKGTIVHPPLETILKGTTLMRVNELARKNGIPTDLRCISIDDLQSAAEVMMTGTTIGILPVVKFEDINIGNGLPGPITQQMRSLLMAEIERGDHGVSF